MTLGHWSMVLPKATARQFGGPIHPIWHHAPGVACLNLLEVVVEKCMLMGHQGLALKDKHHWETASSVQVISLKGDTNL